MTDQIDLSTPLQRHILAAVIRVPGLMSQCRPFLNPDFFPDPAVADIVAWTNHHWDEHHELPSRASLLDVFKADEDVQGVIRKAFKEEVPDPAHIRQRIFNYAQHRALRLAVSEAARVVAAQGRGEVLKDERNRPLYTDPDAYIRLQIDKALMVARDQFRDEEFLDLSLEEGIDNILNPKKTELFHTGFDHLDQAGVVLERGEVGCILAPTKRGKSHVLLNIALQQLREGRNVAYYNLEMPKDRLRQRWYKRVAGTRVDMKVDPEAFVNKLRERFPKLIRGKCCVRKVAAKTFSPSDLRAHLSSLVDRGFAPDMVLVDYVGIMKPAVIMAEQRFNLANLWLDFRSICQEFNAAGWSPAQTNRDGADSEVVTMTDIAESFEVIQHVDSGFSICMDRMEHDANQGRFFVFASRNEQDGAVVDFTHDLSRSIFKTVGFHRPTKEKRRRGASPSEEAEQEAFEDAKARRNAKDAKP